MTDMISMSLRASDFQNDEHAAIAEAIRAETLAFQQEDFGAWAEHWVHDERTRDIYVSPTAGVSVLSGWAAVADHMQKVFQDGISCKIREFGQENLRIDLQGDFAWVIFDSWSSTGHGTKVEGFDTRILQRISGEWKIIYSSYIQRQNVGSDDKTLGLDQKGRVVWAGPGILDALRHHPILTVSAGRLRAHRSGWDKELQRALAQAGRHHGFFETHKFSDDLGGPAHYPVILGRTDQGGVAVVHFSIRDCVTYVQVDGDDQLDRRLQFAQKVFGLSQGQLRVARQIALGAGLKVLAEDLGISVNTARTHLSRLYEKTGVHSQPALVRLLLSVG